MVVVVVVVEGGGGVELLKKTQPDGVTKDQNRHCPFLG